MEQIINEEKNKRKIYRYEFSRELMDQLYNFSKIHQFKSELVSNKNNLLRLLGFFSMLKTTLLVVCGVASYCV